MARAWRAVVADGGASGQAGRDKRLIVGRGSAGEAMAVVVLGRIAAPHGVQGWVRVEPFGDDPAGWLKVKTWWLGPLADAPPEQWHTKTLESGRWAGGKLDLRFADVADRDSAEAIKGWFVGVPRESLPATKAGEYYWQDLIGLRVTNLPGDALGVVTGLIETGANDVLVVRDGEQERLIPFIESVVRRVDSRGGVVVVDWGTDW